LLLPQHLSTHNIIQLPVRTVSYNPLREGRTNPWKPRQILGASPIQINFCLRERFGFLISCRGSCSACFSSSELARGQKRHSSQNQRASHCGQCTSASHGLSTIAR
jgi:hypothetical protein